MQGGSLAQRNSIPDLSIARSGSWMAEFKIVGRGKAGRKHQLTNDVY
jgi:hypothetical protein